MTPYYEADGVTVYCGDNRIVLPSLASASINCCVTSPPYWSLRDYGVAPTVWGGDDRCAHAWGVGLTKHRGGPQGQTGQRADRDTSAQNAICTVSTGTFCQKCGAWLGCLGLEPTPELYIAHLVLIFREVRRVLRDDGTLWLNIGDSYNAYNGNRGPAAGINKTYHEALPSLPGGYGLTDKSLKPKDLIGIPWMLAFALRDDGWYLRQDIIWHKPNPMPESVTDRCTKAHEYLFLLSKSERYYYDAEAIAHPVAESSLARWNQDIDGQQGSFLVPGKTNGPMKAVGGGRVVGRGVHGSSKARGNDRSNCGGFPNDDGTRNARSVWTVTTQPFSGAHFATFPPKLIEPCILAGCPDGGTVLDPFCGAGTTPLVCQQQHVRCVGIELNPDYCGIIAKRLAQGVLPFGEAVPA